MNKPLASLRELVSHYLHVHHSFPFFDFFFCIEQDEGGKFVIGGHKILKYKLAAMMMK